MKVQMSAETTQIQKASTQTPAERRRLRVRDAIIEAAERVFAQEGPDGLSIRRLADEIDYSPSAIYKYFTSKTELVSVLKEDFFEGLVKKIEEVKARPDIPLDVCARDSVSTYIHTALARPYHYAAAFSGAGEGVTFGPDGVALEGSDTVEGTFRLQAFSMLYELVSECRASGIFRADLELGPAAKSLWASMHGLAMLMIHLPGYGTSFEDRDDMAQDAFIDFHADLVVRGLLA